MMILNNHKMLYRQIVIRRVILFLACYEYLNRLLHEYDSLGRPISLRYPDNETVSYDYDDGGNLTNVSNYAAFSNFNALGQAGTITYANGVTTTQQYYPENNRLFSITTNSPTAGGLQNMSYGYDNAGNIGTISDWADSSRTQTFSYDELNRLRFATSAVYGTLEYRFNAIGNMIYNSRVGNYAYGTTKPHAVTQAGTNSYTYDPNGNMITRNGLTISYDYDNRAVSLQGNSMVYNLYDYSGQRVKKNETVYIGKLYECTGSSCIKYLFAGSTRIASQSASKTYFYHADHLGSSSVVTDERGYIAQETYYYPFGETRVSNGSVTHYKFTGQEEDPETGLYYYNARYYDPVLGRFISADSIVQAAFDPQTLNRYSYCINNPLIYTDPSGHLFIIDDIIIAAVSYIAANAAVIAEGAAIGAAIGGTTAAVTGGNIWQGMLTGAVSGAIFAGVGSIPGMNTFSPFEQAAIHAGAGAASGGINSAISGGNIGMGMLTGGISGGIANYAGGFLPNDFGYQLAGSAMIGGVTGGITAVLYGGDFGRGFAMGAETGAIGFMANNWLHKGFAKLLSKMENKSVMKTIKSMEKVIAEHEAKLEDPSHALCVKKHEADLVSFRAQLRLAEQEAARRGLLGAGFAEGISNGEASRRTDSWFDWFDPNLGAGYAY